MTTGRLIELTLPLVKRRHELIKRRHKPYDHLTREETAELQALDGLDCLGWLIELAEGLTAQIAAGSVQVGDAKEPQKTAESTRTDRNVRNITLQAPAAGRGPGCPACSGTGLAADVDRVAAETQAALREATAKLPEMFVPKGSKDG